MACDIPQWLLEGYETWGSKILEKAWSERKLARKAGLTRYKAGRLIKYTKERASLGETVSGTSKTESSTEEMEALQLHNKNYLYDKEKDVYTTFLRCVKRPVIMSGEKHRSIIQAYSNWDGTPATINEVARNFKMPRPWLVEYLRQHEITHDREPFSAEDVAKRPLGELVDDALQGRRSALYQKYEAEKWKTIKKDALKWAHFDESVLGFFKTHLKELAATKVPQLKMSESAQEYALVMGLTDFHWGGYAWGGETEDSYSREKAERRLRQTTEKILKRLPGRPQKIILPVGSDFFHVDGDKATTTRGTPQDVDGTPSEILITGCKITQQYVEMLRQVAPVEVVLMSGNHDRSNGLTVLMYLSAYYKDASDVEVVQNYSPRVYREYGNTLIAFSHGDGCKPKDLGPVMATEARQAWGRTQYHVAFGGHLHHQKVHEVNGIVHYLMPSLSGADRWHVRNGYTTGIPGLCAYLVDEEEGVIGNLFVPAS